MKRSKQYEAVEKAVDKNMVYKLEEAVKLVKETARAKFDETVELTLRLGINAKKSDQMVRGTLMLPHGTGKTKVVAVVAKGEKIKEAKDAGAEFAGAEELIDDIAKEKIQFDVLVATPDSMRDLSKIAKMLGPKGLMPNPKSGTVTFDIAEAIKRIKAGEVAFRNNDAGVVNLSVGKVSFEDNKISENIKSAMDAIVAAKPAAAKGQFLKAITIASTMGPGVKVEIPRK